MKRLTTLLALLLLPFALHATPQIEKWQTDNGARVYFVAAPELPMVDIQLVFDAGSAKDGDRPGLAMLTNGMLEEGVGQGREALDATAIAEQFDRVGAQFSTGSYRDMALLSLRSLSDPKRLDPAVATFVRVLSEPSFPPDALERVRNQMLVGLQAEEESPGKLASRAFYRALYGDHPYAIPSSGTKESVTALSRQELVDFYRRYYVARNAVIAIVGALTRKEAEALAERLVARIPAGEAAPAVPPAAAVESPRQLHIDHPSSQTHILIGQPAIRRGDPDYFPLYLGNHVLGGSGLVSRLSNEIREKRGLAYSVYSYFAPMRAEGPFVLGLQTKNSSAEEAIKLLDQTLKQFIDEGPSEEELTAAKRNITGGFALEIDSNSEIADYLVSIGFYGLPLDYLDTFQSRIEAVSAEQIRDALRRRIHPERLITVTAGSSSQ